MKTLMKKMICTVLAICFVAGMLSAVAGAATLEFFEIPETVAIYELDGASKNGKNTCEYFWIDAGVLYVAFCSREDKQFNSGYIEYDGGSEPLSFDGNGYRHLKIGASQELAPRNGGGGTYYWQIASCTMPAGVNSGDIEVHVSGTGGGFTINGHPLGMKYGMEVTKTLVSVNGGSSAVSVKVGDKLRWEIKVKNTGDFSLNGVVVTDELSYDGGGAMSGTADLSETGPFSLNSGTERILYAEYEVETADAGKTIVNTATATDENGLQASAEDKVSVEMLPATVTWKNDDGTTLEIDTDVLHGTVPVYVGTPPTKASTAQYSYQFIGWDPDPSLTVVTGGNSYTYTAKYQETLVPYTVTWKNWDGSVLDTDTVEYGMMPVYSGATPTRADTDTYTYSFDGWTPTVDVVTDDVTYTAVFTETHKTYTVTLSLLLNDEKVNSSTVHGTEVIPILRTGPSAVGYPAVRTATGVYTVYNVPNGTYRIYKEGSSEPICGQIVIVEDYNVEKSCYYYSVSYEGNGAESAVPAVKNYHLGTAVKVAGGTPVRSGHIFKGWLCDGNVYQPGESLTASIAKKCTLTAQWVETVGVTVNVVIDHTSTGSGYDSGASKADVPLIELIEKVGTDYWQETGASISLAPGAGGHDNHTVTYEYPVGESDFDKATKTTYTADAATFAGLDPDKNYSVTVTKAGYDVVGWDIVGRTITVTLKHVPDSFELEFSVEMADKSNPATYPDAAIVKVLYWDGDSWEIISQQSGGLPGTNVSINKSTGTGSADMTVWKEYNGDICDYRIAVISFLYDGTAHAAGSTDFTEYTDGVYTAVMQPVGTAGHGHDGLDGAYWGGSDQAGTLSAEISLGLYDVHFEENGGTVIGDLADQYRLPDLTDDAYIPAKSGGYVFDGWYTNSALTVPAVGSVRITKDTTLYAKWIAPLTVSAVIEVAGTYDLDGNPATTDDIKIIQDADRAGSVTALLQYAPKGSTAFTTQKSVAVPISYPADKTLPGSGSCEFNGLPNDGGTWRIHLLNHNYTTIYANEAGASGTETDGLNSPSVAVDKNGDNDAVVDVAMSFTPQLFDLKYKVDASGIGTSFRPNDAEVLVLYDDNAESGRTPQEWPVISQMQTGGTAPHFTYTGETVSVGTGAVYPVWSYHPNGHLYDYAIRVQSVDGSALTGAEPYTVQYNGLAEYGDGKELTATLTPKSYTVTFDLNAGGDVVGGMDAYRNSVTGVYETTHSWSHDTPITAAPVRVGYTFTGWTADVSGAYVGGNITAETAQNVTLKANWSINVYTVTWENWDGSVLDTDDVPYGEMPGYEGGTPAKTATVGETYTFAGWSPSISQVTGDVTYTAVYTPKVRTYTVTWKNYDDSELKSEDVEYGTLPNYGSDPYRAPDSEYVYTFAGWTPAVVAVTGDATYTATYSHTDRLYTGRAKMYLNDMLKDVEDVLGAGTKLYFSKDEIIYYELTGDDGVYSNFDLPNGKYHLYSKGVGAYTQVGTQTLDINGGYAEISVHYYSVTYDLNTGAPVNSRHYLLGDAVGVDNTAPVRSGYIFRGWLCDGNVYQPGETLAANIVKNYMLTAQWVETVGVKVNVVIDHTSTGSGYDSGASKADVPLIELIEKVGTDYWQETGASISLAPGAGEHDKHTVTYEYPVGESDFDKATKTTYTADTDTFTGLDPAKDYSVTVTKAGYDVVGWDIVGRTITVTLKHVPDSFELEFSVEMADKSDSATYPDAAIVKVLYWDGDSWEIISQQSGGLPGTNVSINKSTGIGNASVTVWKEYSSDICDYRIAVISFLYDGAVHPVTSTNFVDYTDGVYTAVMQDVGTTGHEHDGLDGAYWGGSDQAGTLSAEISLGLYDVYFEENGGSAIGDLTDRYRLPDLTDDAYIPTKSGGYVFDGWYTDSALTVPAVSGVRITADTTLYAKWIDPLIVSGNIYIAGSYGSGIVIPDRPETAEVTLYRVIKNSSYAEIYGVLTVDIHNEDGGGNPLDPGEGSYAFTVPNDGSTYYISVAARNFDETFWNEKLGTAEDSYGDYHEDNYTAEDEEPNGTAVVHAYLVFNPKTFILDYVIDASAIESAFRPTEVSTLVQYDDQPTDGYTWDTISQQIGTGGQESYFGTNGRSEDSYAVWQYHPLGHAYNYRILLESVTYKPDGINEDADETNFMKVPFNVTYTYPAFYDAVADDQNMLLTAVLTPKTYQIIYDLSGGSWPIGVTPVTVHTWSKETAINAVPVRSGYVFDGWEANVGGVYVDDVYVNGKITAATVQAVTLRAKWIKIRDISVVGESGTVTYTGAQQSVSGFTVEGLPAGYTCTGLTYEAAGTAVGSYGGSFGGKAKVMKGSIDVTDQFRFALIPGVLVIKADDNGDGVPDDRQKKIIFKVVDGTWTSTGTDEKVIYVDLDVSGNGTMTLPVDMQPNAGYAGGAWDGGEPNTAVSGTNAGTYTYRYSLITGLSYTVNYLEKGTGNVLAPAKTQDGMSYGESVTAVSQKIAITGYRYDSADVSTLTIGDGANVLNLYYEKDPSATKTLRYVVKHLLDGVEQSAHTVTYEETVWINDPDVLNVVAGSLDAKTFDGYRYVSADNLPTGSTIANGTVVSLNYEKKAVIPVMPLTGSLSLTKVDAEDRTTKLANVVFELYQSNGTLVGTYTTGTDGTIAVRDLLAGVYYWVEVRPAEGYMLDASKREVMVLGGMNWGITVANTRTPVPEVFSGEHYAYVIGYDDGTVRPEANITRAEVATIFFRLLDDATRKQYMTEENSFHDVDEGMWFNTAVSTMAAMGVVNGYPDGNFHPNDKITRAEFAAIAARFDLNGNTTGVSFRDVYGHWAQKEINLAYNNGWILGYEDRTFKPDQEITRAEALMVINRILQRIPESKSDLLDSMVTWIDNMDETKWYYLTVQEATNSHGYDRKDNGHEYWTEMEEIRDWTTLEQ